jgi:hypothetical protein
MFAKSAALRSGRLVPIARSIMRCGMSPMAAPQRPAICARCGGDLAVGPTPERADESGRPSRPYRAVDTLAAMERRGSITTGMRQAGEGFRARFAVAQLDPLRAPDLSRPRESAAPRFRHFGMKRYCDTNIL